MEPIGLLGFRVSVAADHVEVVSERTGERLFVYRDAPYEMATGLAGIVG